MVLMRPSLGRRGSYAATALNVAPEPRLGDLRADRHRHGGGGPVRPASSASRASGCGRSSSGCSRPRWRSQGRSQSCAASSAASPLGRARVARLPHVVDDRQRRPRRVWSQPGGGESLWYGIDLMIALPASWLPLIADYTRFSRDKRSAFAGSADRLSHPERLALRSGRAARDARTPRTAIPTRPS